MSHSINVVYNRPAIIIKGNRIRNNKLASHWLRVAEAYRQCAVSRLSKGPATYPNHIGALNALSRAQESRDVALRYM